MSDRLKVKKKKSPVLNFEKFCLKKWFYRFKGIFKSLNI